MRKTKKYTFVIFVLLFLWIVISIWTSYNLLETTYFEFPTGKLDEEIKVAILADLHDHEFGASNQKLISKVKEEKPDIILVLGDMLNATSQDSHVAVDVTKGLSEIAPVYYALGNHELEYVEMNGESLLDELEAAGATILELSSQELEVRGQKICIGGMYDYAFALDDNATTDPENMPAKTYEFLDEFDDSESLKIMLSHRPDSFIFGEAPATWDIDLVVSAHNHGGQVILPILGGLFGGDQGWFPDYVYGMYSFEKYDMLITRGLGSNPKILPRFNNRPEVMVLTLGPVE